MITEWAAVTMEVCEFPPIVFARTGSVGMAKRNCEWRPPAGARDVPQSVIMARGGATEQSRRRAT